jgi:hypothetical protein
MVDLVNNLNPYAIFSKVLWTGHTLMRNIVLWRR